MSWQNMRTMSDVELRQALKSLRLSQSACGRYLGLGPRTVFGYLHERRPIPAQTALLLNALLELRIAPIVPPPKRRTAAQDAADAR